MTSAVQWLVNQLEKYEDYAKISYKCLGEIEVALEMEKDEHGKTWDAAIDKYEARARNYTRAWEDFDEYYEERFKEKTREISGDFQKLISQAQKNITRIKGSEYSPTSREIQNEINNIKLKL